MLWGEPGIGKSERIETAAAMCGLPARTTYVPTCQPEDAAGSPFQNTSKGMAMFESAIFTLDDRDPTMELPVAQLRVCTLLDPGPRTISDLAKELGITVSAVTQLADRLDIALARNDYDLFDRVAGLEHGERVGKDRFACDFAQDLVPSPTESFSAACRRYKSGSFRQLAPPPNRRYP